MRVLAFILAFIVSFSTPAIAGTPSCGDIEQRDIKDVFNDAHSVRIYVDTYNHLGYTCQLLEQLKDWEKQQDAAGFDGLYFLAKKTAIEDTKSIFNYMKAPLTIIRVWYKIEPETTEQKQRGVASIKKARKDLDAYQLQLETQRKAIKQLMAR